VLYHYELVKSGNLGRGERDAFVDSDTDP